MLSYIYIGIGGILIGNFLFMIFVSNLNLGLIGSCFIGCYFLGWGIVKLRFPKGIFVLRWKWVHRVLMAGITLLIGISLFLGIYGNFDTVTYQEDALIVLGAAVHGETVSLPLRFRLDCAVKYAKENPDALIVVSGGQGPQEAITEALAMQRYLIAKGVTNPIITEEKATSTYENFLYSKELLDKQLGEEYQVAFVTNDFHIYRSKKTANKAGFETVSYLHGKTAWYNLLHNYLRESLAVMKLWVFG